MRAPRVPRGFSASRQRRPAPQRGGWGSVPPDPGSAPTRKVAAHKYISPAALPGTNSNARLTAIEISTTTADAAQTATHKPHPPFQ
jgi:hypothetical protein